MPAPVPVADLPGAGVVVGVSGHAADPACSAWCGGRPGLALWMAAVDNSRARWLRTCGASDPRGRPLVFIGWVVGGVWGGSCYGRIDAGSRLAVGVPAERFAAS